MNSQIIELAQRGLRFKGHDVAVDGKMGSETLKALQALETSTAPSGSLTEPPGISERDRVYGAPRKPYPHLTTIRLPYEMVLAWDESKVVGKISCHEKIAKNLLAALTEWHEHFGDDGILEHGLHLYGGCYNHRRVRGGRSWSDHAYGIAIDINPDENGLRTPWHRDKVGLPGYAKMPVEAIEIMERHGFRSIAAKLGRDVMHFSAVNYGKI